MSRQSVRPSRLYILGVEMLEDRRLLSGTSSLLSVPPPAAPASDLAPSQSADQPQPATAADPALAANDSTTQPSVGDPDSNPAPAETGEQPQPASGNDTVPPASDTTTQPGTTDPGTSNANPTYPASGDVTDPNSGTTTNSDNGVAVVPVANVDHQPIDVPASVLLDVFPDDTPRPSHRGDTSASDAIDDSAPPLDQTTGPTSHHSIAPTRFLVDLASLTNPDETLTLSNAHSAETLSLLAGAPGEQVDGLEPGHATGPFAGDWADAHEQANGDLAILQYHARVIGADRASSEFVAASVEQRLTTTTDETALNDYSAESVGQGWSPAGMDLASLDQGMRQFLDQLDALGAQLARSPALLGLTSWLLAAGVAAAAVEMGRRQLKALPGRAAWEGLDHDGWPQLPDRDWHPGDDA